MNEAKKQFLVPDDDDDSELDLITLWNAVVSRIKLCCAVCCVIVGAAVVYCYITPPEFLATARVFVPLNIASQQQNGTSMLMATQVQDFSSQKLLDQLPHSSKAR